MPGAAGRRGTVSVTRTPSDRGDPAPRGAGRWPWGSWNPSSALRDAGAVSARSLDDLAGRGRRDDLHRVATPGQVAQVDRRGEPLAGQRPHALAVDAHGCVHEGVDLRLAQADAEVATTAALARLLGHADHGRERRSG